MRVSSGALTRDPLHLATDADKHADASTAQHFPLADHIIILDGDGKIAEQGTWGDLRARAGYISKVVLKEQGESEEEARNDTEERATIQIPPKQLESSTRHTNRKTGDFSLYGMLPSYPSTITGVMV